MKKVVHWNCTVTVLKLEDKKNLALKNEPKMWETFFSSNGLNMCPISMLAGILLLFSFSVFQFFSSFSEVQTNRPRSWTKNLYTIYIQKWTRNESIASVKHTLYRSIDYNKHTSYINKISLLHFNIPSLTGF